MNKKLEDLVHALTFYSDILENIRRKGFNRDLLDAQEHLVFSINKIKKTIKDTTRKLHETRGE